MGGKPSRQTPADRRLKENRSRPVPVKKPPAPPKRTSGVRPVPDPAGYPSGTMTRGL